MQFLAFHPGLKSFGGKACLYLEGDSYGDENQACQPKVTPSRVGAEALYEGPSAWDWKQGDQICPLVFAKHMLVFWMVVSGPH